MTRTLVIDSATDACSVALFEGSGLVAGEWLALGRGHAERLVPMIAALPDKGRADRIAVALGPGSFTGIRVGLAAAKALGVAWHAPLVGYSTLALLAAQARIEAGEQELAVVNAGGHGEWFVESFDAEGRSTAPVRSLKPEAAAEAGLPALAVGSRAEALIELRKHGEAMPLSPDARAFAALPRTALLDDIRPIYGRAPDAKPAGGGMA
ncbi:tRNA (adenosine(37)-N6)-threonylcarbamoyltransferase complex dimerization subunit type 1 TsaB [Croceicoccus bisphenolivorans]|uniref:tRNA (adenosine(37)-N6)-threonylcarbamoyltransferase complex dimerization subunit type 1 TsaB n=1 Tax=Croceicoccus bisphenolivorans TaxID=1783232 RepID=UPI00082DA87E|nr:tRNA (adenosine(37)-N6)-threonylcarbamoyltransferase complex dimerization subunit type 1 TsaB [Croceicoccus bisphenolivorans]